VSRTWSIHSAGYLALRRAVRAAGLSPRAGYRNDLFRIPPFDRLVLLGDVDGDDLLRRESDWPSERIISTPGESTSIRAILRLGDSGVWTEIQIRVHRA
jgi:hypothetical protein